LLLGGGGNDVYTVDSALDKITESIGGKAGGIDVVTVGQDVIVG
jgi:hypothetical protein